MGNCCSEEIDFDGDVDLTHFELQRSVGKGAFGKVRIIQKKDDKKIYALKYINKLKCLQMKAVTNIIQERRLLEEIHFPLCVNLRYAFQDDENLFMAIDLMLGGDLRFHLDRTDAFKESQFRLYVAEMGLAIRFLNEKRIVHRDLKPENVLLSETGHAHLTDFNIATRFTPDKPLMAVAGSMAYMAPEIFHKKGYFAAVDWWSIGVCMYEFMYGKRPFRGKTNELLEEAICKDPVVIPDDATKYSKECMEVLHGLLERDSTKRLGVDAEQWTRFREHAWFKLTLDDQGPINFDTLADKALKPSFIPDSKKLNFDATHELEELLVEDNSLSTGKKASKRMDPRKLPGGPEGPFSKELIRLEAKFTDFNYERRNTAMVSKDLLTLDPKDNPAGAGAPAGHVSVAKELHTADQNEDKDTISYHDIDNFERQDAAEDEKKAEKKPQQSAQV